MIMGTNEVTLVKTVKSISKLSTWFCKQPEFDHNITNVFFVIEEQCVSARA